ncbi:MAG: S41 family peptidase [Candidatus Paceibacterota bacterium]|jgi:hypothetical protein
MFKKRLKKIIFFGIILIIIAIASAAGIFYYKNDNLQKNLKESLAPQYKTVAENDLYVRFVMEAYDSIEKNYWMKPGNYKTHNSPELPELFNLSLKKAANLTETPKATDRNSTAEALATTFSNATSSDAKKQLALQTITVLTYNLLPLGRNGLFSEQQQIALRQEVSNINPTNDLYENLGLEKGASPKQIESAYEKKAAVLKKDTSAEAKAELKKIAYAKNVLTDENSKALYDEVKVEPTVFSRIIGNTLYIYFKKISPTSLQEFGIAVMNASTTKGLNNMIIDLRGNIGGDLAFSFNFLGLFIGPNQYVFDLFRNGDYLPIRTTQPKFDAISRYKEIAVLTDNKTQSTAELTTAALKRLNIAHAVGAPTAGWGTIENTYPLETVIDPGQKYSLYLVNHITLGDDNQPIEGKGIIPDVDIKSSDWKTQLKKYFNSESFIQIIRQRVVEQPLLY